MSRTVDMERGTLIADAIMLNLFAKLPPLVRMNAVSRVWFKIPQKLRDEIVLTAVCPEIISQYDDAEARMTCDEAKEPDTDDLPNITHGDEPPREGR